MNTTVYSHDLLNTLHDLVGTNADRQYQEDERKETQEMCTSYDEQNTTLN